MSSFRWIGWTVGCVIAGSVLLTCVYRIFRHLHEAQIVTEPILKPKSMMFDSDRSHGISQQGMSMPHVAAELSRELAAEQLEHHKYSLGPPIIWPKKSDKTLAAERDFRAILDKERLAKKHIGTMLTNAEEKPKDSFKHLSGSQPFTHADLFAMSSGLVREMERPVDNRIVLNGSDEFSHKNGTDNGIPGFGQAIAVFHDGTSFTLFYRERRKLIGRARSADGVNWRDRKQADFPYVQMTDDDLCIMHDAFETRKEYKWKMTYTCDNKQLHKRGEYRMWICLAASANGINWKVLNERKPFAPPYADTLACLHHDAPGDQYFLTTRYEHSVGNGYQPRGVRGTSVILGNLVIGRNGRYSIVTWEPHVLAQWVLDKEYGEAEKYRRQLYALSRASLPRGAHVGIAWVYEFPGYTYSNARSMTSNRKKAEQLGIADYYDTVRLYLLPSRDGIHFDHSWVYAGVPLLPADDMSRYHFQTAAAQIVTHDGYHWIFYDRSVGLHEDRWYHKAEIAVARFYEGRFVKVRTVGTRGFLITKSFQFDPSHNLYIDVTACSPQSDISVALLHGAANQKVSLAQAEPNVKAIPVRGVDGMVAIEWHTSPKDLLDQNVHLRVDLTESAVYGFYFGDKPPRNFKSCGLSGTTGIP